jgi:hypothetical protein
MKYAIDGSPIPETAEELEAAYALEIATNTVAIEELPQAESDYRNTSSDVTPDPTSIEAVRHAFTSYLFVPDTTMVDVTMAAYVANHMPGDPVWLNVIGAPSRGKTEIVSSLADMPDVHMISTLTPQTFASGVRKDRNASLLYRLEDQGKRVIVLKDLTTVLTMNRDARDMVFGALREIYDGRFSKEFGTGESIQWEGKLGLIAGVTPVIDRHHVALAQLGDRFILLRLPEVQRLTVSGRSLDMMGTETEERQEMRRVVRAFLESVDMSPRKLSQAAKDAIIPISDLVTHARTGVYRDGYKREIDDIPELEAPARLAKQVAMLELGLEAIGHDETSALDIIRRVSADTIPPARMVVLRLLAVAPDAQDTTTIATQAHMPTVSARRVLEDLEALRLVERMSLGPGRADRWMLGLDAVEKWGSAGL